MPALEKRNVGGLSCLVHRAGPHAVVCCHGLYSSKQSLKQRELAVRVVARDLSCVRFDFRGCGESTGTVSHRLADRVADLETVMTFARATFPDGTFGLFGSSFGGMTALAYAARNPVATTVVVATPCRIEFEDESADITRDLPSCSHVLVMHGAEDALVDVADAEQIYRHVREPKKLKVYATDHVFSHDDIRGESLDEALAWFTRYLE
jgi:alpha-beta hydrolase superfamily lysophospholipase